MKNFLRMLSISIMCAVAPAVMLAQNVSDPINHTGLDLNLAAGKSAETGPGAEISSTLYINRWSRINPSVFCGWISGVKTHGGTASATQCGYNGTLEVPVLAKKRFELAPVLAIGYLRSRYHYDVVVDGESFSGVERASGPYIAPGLKFTMRINRKWSAFIEPQYVAYGTQTQNNLGQMQINFGVSRHFDLDLFHPFRKH